MASTGNRGGKRPKVDAYGYYGIHDAGNRMEARGNTAGTKREFVGTKTREFTFSNTLHGTHTFTAETYEEALRIAKSLGYTQGDYKKR